MGIKKRYYFLIVLVAVLSSIQSFAAGKFVRGDLNVSSTSYTTPYEERPELDKSQHLFANLLGQYKKESVELKGQWRTGIYTEINNSYNIFPEAYLHWTSDSLVNVSLGRELNYFSEIDEAWLTSFWQPVYNVDPLVPVVQGLTGLTLTKKIGNFELFYFDSSVYSPNLGPEYKNSNGELEFSSRWYPRQKTEISLQDRKTQILYQLDRPELEKIVLQRSWVLKLGWGERNRGVWFVASHGRKPMNELAVNYEPIIKEGFADVRINPHVIHHEITSVDLGYATGDQRYVISGLADRPETAVSVGETWVAQNYAPAQAISARAELSLRQWLNVAGSFGVGRLRVYGGEAYDVDFDGQTSRSANSLPRVRYRDAWMVDFSNRWRRILRSEVSSSFKFIHDQEQQGSILTAEIKFKPVQTEWNLNVGFDVLGVDSSESTQYNNYFLRQFSANDRFFAGASYVF